MYQILNAVCNNDNIESCCSDYGIAAYINVVKKVLDLIHMFVPIVLLFMIVIQLVKMMLNPDDQGGKLIKGLRNKILAAVIIFFLPYVVNVAIKLVVPKKFELSKCWEDSDEIVSLMNQNNDNYNEKSSNTKTNSSSSKSNGKTSNSVKKKNKKQNKTNKKNSSNSNNKNNSNKNNNSSSNSNNKKSSNGSSRYILVGDSRTVLMYSYVNNTWDNAKTNKLSSGLKEKNVYWSCKSSMGLEWLKSTGIPNVENSISSGSSLVIMMGVNDLYNAKKYRKYINDNAKKWKNKGATVYFVSVNPTNGKYEDLNSTIDKFNKYLSRNLKNVNWLDTNKYMKEQGYRTTDGLHYDKSTSIKLYKYIKSHT